MPSEAETLCWRCKNAVPGAKYGCSWSRGFKPVDGWTARETKIMRSAGEYYYADTSYLVKKCPEYIPDKPKPKVVVTSYDSLEILCRKLLYYADLTAPQRIVLQMRYIQNMKRREIAEQRKISINTLDSMLTRAKKKILLCAKEVISEQAAL